MQLHRVGVVARIGAFNHPLLFVAGKAGAPLAAGNTLVLKPSEVTSGSAFELARLAEVGLSIAHLAQSSAITSTARASRSPRGTGGVSCRWNTNRRAAVRTDPSSGSATSRARVCCRPWRLRWP